MSVIEGGGGMVEVVVCLKVHVRRFAGMKLEHESKKTGNTREPSYEMEQDKKKTYPSASVVTIVIPGIPDTLLLPALLSNC